MILKRAVVAVRSRTDRFVDWLCFERRLGAETSAHVRLEQLGLTRAEEAIYRTKANCLRVCHQGPIAVVYPEGTWYHSVTPEVLERMAGRPAEALQAIDLSPLE